MTSRMATVIRSTTTCARRESHEQRHARLLERQERLELDGHQDPCRGVGRQPVEDRQARVRQREGMETDLRSQQGHPQGSRQDLPGPGTQDPTEGMMTMETRTFCTLLVSAALALAACGSKEESAPAPAPAPAPSAQPAPTPAPAGIAVSSV